MLRVSGAGISSNVMTNKPTRILLISCLLVYLFFVGWILFVSVGSTDRSTYFKNPDDHFIPFQGTIGLIKLAKQYGFRGYYLKMLVRNIAGNFFLFFPLGIMIPLLFRGFDKLGRIAIFVFLLSFAAETIQYLYSLGIFDIDDILLNTIGAVGGYCSLKFIMGFFAKKGFHSFL